MTGVDTASRQVLLEDGSREHFGTLILATGAHHAYFGNDQWETFAPGLKTLEDATELRRRINNSILPEGHTGPVMFFGTMIDFTTLLDIKKDLDSGDLDINDLGAAVSTKYFYSGGTQKLPMVKENLNAFARDKEGVDWSTVTNTTIELEARQKAFKSHLDNLTEGVSIEVPTSDTAALFEYDSMGHPKMPQPTDPNAYGGDLYYHSSTGEYSKYIKQISDAFGGGGIIGLHYGQMSKDQKMAWVNNLKAGNFAAMYDIEMKAAIVGGDDGIGEAGRDAVVRLHDALFEQPLRADQAADLLVEGGVGHGEGCHAEVS